MGEWLKSRIVEQGTWRGLIMLIGGLTGMTIDSGVSEAMIMLCTSVSAAGFHNIVTKG